MDSRLMIDCAYACMVDQAITITYKEQQEKLEKLDSSLRGLDYEWETGLPAVALAGVLPADEMYPDV